MEQAPQLCSTKCSRKPRFASSELLRALDETRFVDECFKGDHEMEAGLHHEVIKTLKHRFEKNMHRHIGIDWRSVQAKLEASPKKIQVLYEMERTGGQPDVH